MTSLPIVGPIDWGAHDGEFVERVLSVMLLRDRGGWRRGSSAGDQGVDVAYPVGGGYQVDQIKSFTGKLTSNRKVQIERSLSKVIEAPELPGPVKLWRLVIPMDPSKEAEKWFRSLTANAPFECQWMGATFVDNLAAENAYTIDYYFRDGRARLQARLRNLRNAVEFLGADPTPIRVGETTQGLLDLYDAVNQEDPHFRYEFEVTTQHLSLADAQRPLCVMASAVGTIDGPYAIIRVFARYTQATEDRPIPVEFTASFDSDDDALREDFRRALAYGADVTLPIGTVRSFTSDAPGGLETSDSEVGELHILGLECDGFVPFRMRLQATDHDGLILGETMIESVSQRHGYQGTSIHFRDLQGAFEFTLTSGVEGDGQPVAEISNFSIDLLTAPAARISDSMKLLTNLRSPNVLSLFPEYGSGPQTIAWRLEKDDPPVHPAQLHLVDAIVALQAHSSVNLHIPLELTGREYDSILKAGQLAGGREVTERWSKLEVSVRVADLDTAVAAFSGYGLASEFEHSITVGDVKVELGRCHKRYRHTATSDVEEVIARSTSLDPQEVVTITFWSGQDDRVEIVPRPVLGAAASSEGPNQSQP